MEKRKSNYVIKSNSKRSHPHICPKCGASFDSICSYTDHRNVCAPYGAVYGRAKTNRQRLSPILQALVDKHMKRKQTM